MSKDSFILDEMTRETDAYVLGIRANLGQFAQQEFVAGHVEGAVNVPAAKLAEHVSQLPADATIVTVCNFGGARSCNAAEQLRNMATGMPCPFGKVPAAGPATPRPLS